MLNTKKCIFYSVLIRGNYSSIKELDCYIGPKDNIKLQPKYSKYKDDSMQSQRSKMNCQSLGIKEVMIITRNLK